MNNRKNYLILPKFQLSFILYICTMALFSILSVFLANQYFFYKMQLYGREIGLAEGHIFYTFLETQKVTMNYIFLGTSVFLFTSTLAFGMFYSHRIAGPIYRITKDLVKIKSGLIKGPINFRKTDYFQDLATII